MQVIRKIIMWSCMSLLSFGCMGATIIHYPDLTEKEHAIVRISALTANGMTNELRNALNDGLNAGLTINESKEILVHLYAYVGFPRSLNGLTTLMELLQQRKADGMDDVEGIAYEHGVMYGDSYERGRKRLEELSGVPQPRPAKGYGEFAPRIDQFLKVHLFADIFDSPVLDHKSRELVTISVLASMDGVESQLNGHLALGKNVGWSDEQLDHIVELARRTRGIDPLHETFARQLV